MKPLHKITIHHKQKNKTYIFKVPEGDYILRSFESIDKKPVDLIFLLLAPEDSGVQHLKALALMSRIMGNKSFCNKLRSSESAESIFSLLTKQQGSKAA